MMAKMTTNGQDGRIDTLEKEVQGLATQVIDLTALNPLAIDQLSRNAPLTKTVLPPQEGSPCKLSMLPS